MEQVIVTGTRTGQYMHASHDKAVTLCGRKVKGVYGPVGTMIETMTMDSDKVFLKAAEVTCEKCAAAL